MFKICWSFVVAFFYLENSQAVQFKMPSSIDLSYAWDNQSNQNSYLDIFLTTQLGPSFLAGLSTSQFSFYDGEIGSSDSFYLGIESDPFEEIIVSLKYSMIVASSQMKVQSAQAGLQWHFDHLSVMVDLGYRLISLELTPQLDQLSSQYESDLVDGNLWWMLGTAIPFGKNWALTLNMTQFNYSTSFEFLSFPNLTEILGYNQSTVNYGLSLADRIASGAVHWQRKKLDASLQVTSVANKVDQSQQQAISVSLGYRPTLKFGVQVSMGSVSGTAPDTETQTAQFSSTSINYLF